MSCEQTCPCMSLSKAISSAHQGVITRGIDSSCIDSGSCRYSDFLPHIWKVSHLEYLRCRVHSNL